MVVESNPGGLSKVGNSNCLNFSSSSTVAIELLVVVVVPLALEYSEEKIISFDIHKKYCTYLDFSKTVLDCPRVVILELVFALSFPSASPLDVLDSFIEDEELSADEDVVESGPSDKGDTFSLSPLLPSLFSSSASRRIRCSS